MRDDNRRGEGQSTSSGSQRGAELMRLGSAAAYVFFPLTILPKLYSLTYLVILLCTPPPRALEAADASAGSSQPTALDSSTKRPLPLAVGSFDSAEHSSSQIMPAGSNRFSSRPAAPGQHSHALGWSKADGGSWGGTSTFHSLGSLPRLAFPVSAWTHRLSGTQSRPGDKDVGLRSELDYYRSYIEALESSRLPRSSPPSPPPALPSVPRIDHPYAQTSAEEAGGSYQAASSAEVASQSDPGHSASTVVSFEIEQDLSGDSFGTLQVSSFEGRC